MCGRFTLTADLDDLNEAFPELALPETYAPRFNIAPTQPVLAVPNDGGNAAGFYIWGLVPSWAKDPSIGARMINARAETLGEKPSFRGVYKHKRCLILADGFYEWKSAPGSKAKIPYFIRMKDGRPFTFAGLWDLWQSPEGSALPTCTIITTGPNELMTSIHNRMPVILPPEARARWLDPAPRRPDELADLLAAYPPAEMEAYAVSALVNSPAHDRPECVLPA